MALKTLSSRGPDDRAVWWSENGLAGLAHCRLAINDPIHGRQPFSGGPAERYVAVVNGEFYDLDSEFSGASDSFALIELYQKHGLSKTLELLRGEFAFLLYDRRERRLLAVRDRFGIKPLFWARLGQEWWFASKASALWAVGVAADWCEASFSQAAITQYPPSGGSLFASIETLKPSHYLSWQAGEMSCRRYWQVPTLGSARPLSSESLRESLEQCVNLRLRAQDPTAVLLSGGIDSASVLALAAGTGKDLKAYTIDFPESGPSTFSEGGAASRQARFSGVPHQLVPLTKKDILTGLEETVRRTEGLFVNGHGVAKMKLAQAVAADGIKVLLSGEGADELLFGYRHFAPYFPSTEALDPFQDSAGIGILTSREKPTLQLPGTTPHFFHAKHALGRKISCFLNRDSGPVPFFQKILDDSSLGPTRSRLESARDAWLDTALRSYILEVLGDGTEMAHSVEGRPPFLDHHLWQSCAHLGTVSKGDKALLRKAMAGLVVDEIRAKPKHPFMTPPLGEALLLLLQERVADCPHPYLDRVKTLKILDQVRALTPSEQWEWEPPFYWWLSTFYLQELWA